ncbi:GatB/YqeY domain-containing protein [Candidatus Pelagibacter bacterium]|nr:GatB/YqeY domain-containing protein [Candidatus Pelagibacter bacterium]
MSLKKQIVENLNNALKVKDKKTYPTLRLIVSAIKDAEIAGRSKGEKDIKDRDIIALLKKMIKQRNESCEVYKKAGRTELLENEKREIEVINKFLPNQLSEEETKKICEETIKSVNATSMKDMGKIMGVLKSKHADSLDFSKVSSILKGLLN